MPIITLYGSKGGTCRTTSAAALTIGLLAEGCDVTMLDTNSELRWFETWGKHLEGSGVERCRIAQVEHINQMNALYDEVREDPNRFLVIDTGRDQTELRLLAIAAADIVIAPFGSFMDADHIVRGAYSHMAQDKHLVGLAVCHGEEVGDLVANWMHLLSGTLPADERLDLGSARSNAFVDAILTEGPKQHFKPRGLSKTLRAIASEVKQRAQIVVETPDAFAPAQALLHLDAKVSRIPAEYAA